MATTRRGHEAPGLRPDSAPPPPPAPVPAAAVDGLAAPPALAESLAALAQGVRDIVEALRRIERAVIIANNRTR